MSHVIGQGTIASNHYRTSEYRASQYQTPQTFNSENLEFNATERRAIRNLAKGETDKIKNLMKQAIPDIRKKFEVGDINDEQIKKLLDMSDEDIVKRINNIFDNPANKNENFDWLRVLLDPKGDIANNKAARRQMAKSLRGRKADDFADATADLTDDALKSGRNNADELIENADVSPLTKRIMTTGAIVGTSLGGLAIFLGMSGNEAIQKWVDNHTGMNCGPKAQDQGLEIGTPEYQTAVAECQEDVTNNLMKLGYGALAIVGFVGLVAVTRAIPKKKSPKEDSEDEE